jgi:histidinol-phosphatase (PHP family)
MPPISKNYHTHTYRCQHASGDVDDYCRAAVEQGLSVLGISDHSALPDNQWPGIRMDIAELPRYCRAVDDARAAFPELTVLKGMECEFAEPYRAFYRDTLLGELRFDYLIGAAHFFPLDGEWVGAYGGADTARGLKAYADYFIDSMRSGLFTFMAHPDLFGNCYLDWDANAESAARDILSAAAELNVPLEINGYGLRKPKIDTPAGKRCMYPWLPFWELAAEYNVTAIVNSDAHRPEDVASNLQQAAAIAADLGLLLADLGHLEARRGAQSSSDTSSNS